MLNKKSQVEDWLPLLATIVFLVFLVILVFPSRSIARTKTINENIDMRIIGVDSSQLLLNYLRSPPALGNLQSPNTADAISQYFEIGDENSLKQINKTADDVFSRSILESDSYSWSLEIHYPEKEVVVIESEKAKKQYISRKEVSKIGIPAYYNDKTIEITLFLVQTKFTVK